LEYNQNITYNQKNKRERERGWEKVSERESKPKYLVVMCEIPWLVCSIFVTWHGFENRAWNSKIVPWSGISRGDLQPYFLLFYVGKTFPGPEFFEFTFAQCQIERSTFWYVRVRIYPLIWQMPMLAFRCFYR